MDLKKRTLPGITSGVDDLNWLANIEDLGRAESCTLDVTAFDAATHYPTGFLPAGLALARNASTGLYGPYTQTTDEAQTVTITGTPTGGTFTLTYSGQTTAAIAYNATAATVQARLEALSNIAAGDVVVAGGPGPGTAYSVTFAGALADTNVAQMTASAAGLTGGTTPAVTVTTATAGGTEVTAAYGVGSGFLYGAIEIHEDGGSVLGAAILKECKVREHLLPMAVNASFWTDVAGRITRFGV